MTFNLDTYGTLVAATLVLLLGRKLIQHLAWLRSYSIPEPVAGGILIALFIWLLKANFDWQINFDLSLSNPLMLAFFATIGLTSNLASLRAGGKPLVKFVFVVTGLLLLQNMVGIGLATALNLDPLVGLLAGSITMSGGHGTGAAWGSVFVNKYGLTNAVEIGIACATFGLVLGGVIGGPVARYLVKRSPAPPTEVVETAPTGFEQPRTERLITARAMVECLAMISICLLAGSHISDWLKGSAFELPTFVCVLFTGVIISNGLSTVTNYQIFTRAVAVMGNVSLSLFLAMALMSLKLWELASLAMPMFIILGTQAVVMAFYAIFVTYRVMGSNYDAAVLSAGHCGFGLGATPTAIANMQAITDRFGPSHLAFLIVPMVGAFFIDLINALTIQLFLRLPFFQSLPAAL